MRLYHGSRAGIVGSIKPPSQTACDFGRGFYMGTDWTQPLTLICRSENPTLYACELNLEGLNVFRFAKYFISEVCKRIGVTE